MDTLEAAFRVKDAHGRVHDYRPEPYQIWFHAHSPLALGQDAPDRLVPKGRGLGVTLMTGMDLLLLATARPRVHIPVAGRQSGTSDEFVQKSWDLIQDAKVEFNADPELKSAIRLSNGSSLDPLPGGNPNAARSKRAPAMAMDEYAFHPHPSEMWRAARAVLSEGGQMTVVSTHDGSDTHFNELCEQAAKGENDFMLFHLPIHDPQAYDEHAPIRQQVQAGTLKLIAPWLNLDVLDRMRREDPLGYKQENLCDVMDETLNLLSREVVENAHDVNLESWERPLRESDLQLPQDEALLPLVGKITVPERPHGCINPAHVGTDFASEGDISWWTLHEATPEGLRQRWTLPLRKMDTPTQNALARVVARTARPSSHLIDMTGGGTGLYEYARRELKCAVHGIHFASRVRVGGRDQEQREVTSPIKKEMALNLATGLIEGRTKLLGASPHTPLQKRHLRALRRADLDAPRSQEDGHADAFWSIALAAWGSRVGAGPARVVKAGERRAVRGHRPGDLYGMKRGR